MENTQRIKGVQGPRIQVKGLEMIKNKMLNPLNPIFVFKENISPDPGWCK
jgi:hypothetical protein